MSYLDQLHAAREAIRAARSTAQVTCVLQAMMLQEQERTLSRLIGEWSTRSQSEEVTA